MLEAKCMDKKLLAPCGTFCGTCYALNSKQKPSCSGCGNQNGNLFWGKCKLYACASGRVEHCGVCDEFPCDLFIDQYDPADGQRSAFERAGLLIYRKKFGPLKFIEMSKKLHEEKNKKK